MDRAPNVDLLTENILGAIHNTKSTIMAVNGYIDLLAPDKTGELYENAKHSIEKLKRLSTTLSLRSERIGTPNRPTFR